jgi:hypothetical protein
MKEIWLIIAIQMGRSSSQCVCVNFRTVRDDFREYLPTYGSNFNRYELDPHQSNELKTKPKPVVRFNRNLIWIPEWHSWFNCDTCPSRGITCQMSLDVSIAQKYQFWRRTGGKDRIVEQVGWREVGLIFWRTRRTVPVRRCLLSKSINYIERNLSFHFMFSLWTRINRTAWSQSLSLSSSWLHLRGFSMQTKELRWILSNSHLQFPRHRRIFSQFSRSIWSSSCRSMEDVSRDTAPLTRSTPIPCPSVGFLIS